MIKMMSLSFFVFVILSGCSEETVTSEGENNHPNGETPLQEWNVRDPDGVVYTYIETEHMGGSILKDMKPFPKKMKKLIIKHMTYSDIRAILGPDHETFGSGIGRGLWYFDDHTCLLLSNLKEEDGWYHGKPGDGFKVISGKKIANAEVRDEDIDISRTSQDVGLRLHYLHQPPLRWNRWELRNAFSEMSPK